MTTSLAHQTEAELGGPGSILSRQRRDHVRLDELLQELAAAPVDGRPEVLTRIDRLVFSHAFAEETVLWPALRRVLPDGDELTLRVEEEHQQVNELVSRLEQLAPEDPAYDGLLSRTVELLRADVRDEEDVLLPRLQDAVDVATLHRLGRAWQVARRVSPTRPHPAVSRRPPGNALSALPLTVLDRSRDALDTVARRATERVAAPTRRVSAALAGVAGAVERLRPVRRGERPQTSVTPPG